MPPKRPKSSNPSSTDCALISALRLLGNTGSDGLEGLIRDLMERWTGQTFRLARSGSQHGHDIRGDDRQGPANVVEVKNYEEWSMIGNRALAGEIVQVDDRYGNVDLWILAATKEVGSDEVALAQRVAENFGMEVFVLDARSSGLGPLQVFCAAYPDTTLPFLAAHRKGKRYDKSAVDARLKKIRSFPGFTESEKALRKTLSGTLLGFADVKQRMSEWLRNSVSNVADARSAFGQDVALSEPSRTGPIPREAISSELDQWWSARSGLPHFSLLGEEGSGKTWAAMAWVLDLLTGPAAPLVVPVASNQVPDENIFDTLARVLERSVGTPVGGRDIDWWRRRLRNWWPQLGGEQSVLLFIDGLNERPHADWASLVSGVGIQQAGMRVHVLMTCRPAYWNAHMGGVVGRVKVVNTQGYEDDELVAALGERLLLDDVPQDMRPLIRRPRYCDLVNKYFSEMVVCKDFTVERLLFLDFKDRCAKQRKSAYPLNDSQFQEIIGDLATYHRDQWGTTERAPTFNQRELESFLPSDLAAGPAMQEIIDGGLMTGSGSRARPYKVDPARLAFGVGMVLADDLRAQQWADVEAVADHIQAWLEPQPDMDLKASALGAAVFFSLPNCTPDFPAIARRALFREWIAARNSDADKERAVAAYLLECPHDVLAVADHFWRANVNNMAVQAAFAGALLRYRKNEVVEGPLAGAARRWASHIQIHGHPYLRPLEGSPETRNLGDELVQRLGRPLFVGSNVPFYGRDFSVTNDDGLLRLVRFAFLILSAGARAPFVEVFIHWALSSRLMDTSPEREEAAWTLRLTDEDLWTVFEPLLSAMVNEQDETVRKAAHLLLGCLGSRDALRLKAVRLSGLFPPSAYSLQEQADPCTGMFSWQRENCEPCLGRDDVSVHSLVRGVQKYIVDPILRAPDGFVSRLVSDAEALPVERYHEQRSARSEDHLIDEFFPVLARFAPTSLGHLARRMIASLPSRDVMGAQLLGHKLDGLSLVGGDHERSVLEAFCREKYETAFGGGDDENKKIEGFVFAALAGMVSKDELVDRILKRPADAIDLRVLGHWLEPPSRAVAGELATQILVTDEPTRLARLLWVLGGADVDLSDTQREKVIAALDSEESWLAMAAYSFVAQSRDRALIDHVVKGSASFPKPSRSHADGCGASILIHHGGDIPYSDLLLRLSVADAGRAVTVRGRRDDEAAAYANLLDRVWKGIAGFEGPPTETPPSINVSLEETNSCLRYWYRYADERVETSFRSPGASWGGHDNRGFLPDFFERMFEEPEQFEQRQRQYFEVLEEHLDRQGTQLLGEWFDVDALRAVFKHRPDLVQNWVDGVTVVSPQAQLLFHHANGFYQGLCLALTHEAPELAFDLWRRMKALGARVRFMNPQVGVPWLSCAPFEAPDSAESLQARQDILDAAFSDEALSEVATIALAFDRKAWLLERIQSLVQMPALWRKAKGVTLAALTDLDAESFDARVVDANTVGTWVEEEALDVIRSYHDRNLWAKHWYRQFLTAPDRDAAYAGFILFLGCVDRRCRLWMGELEDEARQSADFEEDRVRYRHALDQTIKRAMEKNEKDRRTAFFGIRFKKDELVPFMGRD